MWFLIEQGAVAVPVWLRMSLIICIAAALRRVAHWATSPPSFPSASSSPIDTQISPLMFSTLPRSSSDGRKQPVNMRLRGAASRRVGSALKSDSRFQTARQTLPVTLSAGLHFSDRHVGQQKFDSLSTSLYVLPSALTCACFPLPHFVVTRADVLATSLTSRNLSTVVRARGARGRDTRVYATPHIVDNCG